MSRTTDIALLKLGGLLNRLEGGGHARRPQARAGALIAGRYRLKSVLGQGAMGRVLLVEDLVDRRDVALKITLAGRGATTDAAFRQEFYTLTRLQHPNTVKVYDAGLLPGGDRYLTMELVRGSDLRDLVARGKRPLPEVWHVVSQLGQVLEFIHSRRFVHCDIKAENVRLTERGQVKLMDFGLMLPLGQPSNGLLRGTPLTMAPEIPRGGIIDQRSDLYSLAALAFELLTGRPPYEGRSVSEVISKHLTAPVPKVRVFRPEVPEPVERLLEAALSKQPSERPADLATFLKELSRATGTRVQPQSYAQRSSYLASVELLGREAQVDVLRSAWAETRSGKGRAVFVSAPAGVGKTRLLQEFLLAVKLEDVPSTLGQCRAEGLSPARPIVQALEGLLATTSDAMLEAVAAPLVKLMPGLRARGLEAPSFPDAIAEKAAQVDAVVAWLTQLSTQRSPLVVVLEDLHWADVTTLELLNPIARALSSSRVLLVGTFRGDEVPRTSVLYNPIDAGTATLLEVPPLGAQEQSAMVRAMLKGAPLPEPFLTGLYERTRGNPFFATETLRALIERGWLVLEDGAWTTRGPVPALPSSIADAVSERLDSLEPALAAFAQIAAVGGRVLDLDALEQLSGLGSEQTWQRLDEMLERQFVTRVDERLLFTHDTVRAAIDRRLDVRAREQLHLRWGEVLEAKGALPSALAYHFSRTADERRAVKYLLAAAEGALSVRALTDGARMLVDAARRLEAIDYPDKQATLVSAWARIVDATFSSQPALAVEFGEKLVRHWRGQVDLEAASRTMKRMMGVINRLPRAVRANIKKNIYKERPLDPKTKVPFVVLPQWLQFRTLQSFAYAFVNQWHEATTALDEVGKLIPDPESIFFAGNKAAYGLVYGLTGQLPKAQANVEVAYSVAQRNLETVQMPVTQQVYGNCLLLGPIGQAFGGERPQLERVDEAVRFAESHGLLELVFQGRWPVHVRACLSGDSAEYRTASTQMLDAVRRMGFPPFHESRYYLFDPLFHLGQGHLELAEQGAATLERLGHQLDDPSSTAHAWVFQAQVALARRDLERSRALALRAVEHIKPVESFVLPRALLARAEVELRAPSGAGAAKALLEGEVLPLVERPELRNPANLVTAWRLHGEALGGDAGVARLQQALDEAARQALGFDEAMAAIALARISVKSAPARSAEAFSRARTVFERIGNRWGAALVDELRAKATLGQPLS